MADDTVFAVHAPHGTALEVPDPDSGLSNGPKHYRCAVASSSLQGIFSVAGWYRARDLPRWRVPFRGILIGFKAWGIGPERKVL